MLVLLSLTGAAPGASAEPDDRARAQAKERIEHGLYLVENGAYAAALDELEKAHELAPSRLTLYHIALVYVAMDEPVAALESLEEVLAADGTLKSELVERAKAAKEEQKLRVAELDVKVNVPAVIEVDGERVGEAPLAAPLRVAAGEHVVCVVAPGHVPARQSFTVAAVGRAELVFELEATEAKPARVTVRSPLPGAEVRVDDVLVGKTPIAEPVTVMPGKRVFEMQRSGYMTTHRTLTLADGVYSGVAFDPDEDESAAAPKGRLRLRAGMAGVAVTIDGRSRGVYREPIDLPIGPHTLKLEKTGYEPLERMVDIPAGDDADVKVALRPTEKTLAAKEAKMSAHRKWAIAALASGVAIAGGGTAFALWSNGKLPAAEDKLATAKNDANGTCPPGDATIPEVRQKICREQVADAQKDVDAYRSYRLYGFIGAGVGVALAVTGIVLLFSGPEASGADETTVASSLEPVVSAGPDGAALWLRGRF